MRLLVISPFLVYPGVGHAGGEFLYRHMEYQRRHFDVSLVGLDTPDNRDDLVRVGEPVPLLSMPDATGRDGRRWRDLVARLGWNILALTPTQLGAMVSPVAREIAAADVVEVHWAGWLAPLFPVLRSIAPHAVIAAHPYDVPWEADATRAAMSSQTGLRARVSSWLFQCYQMRMLGHGDLVVVLTRRDQATLEAAGLSGIAVVADPPLEAPPPPEPPPPTEPAEPPPALRTPGH
ncbi:MAG: hypothetical protein ACRDYC_02380, partial [Acidimicrobiales bacterium]